MATEQLPSSMRAIQWTTLASGIEKNLALNPSAPLPKDANFLPSDSTLVKVAYSSPNPVDYKLPEATLYRNLKLSVPAIPCGDYSGTVVASTLPHLEPGARVFGRSDPPYFGALAEYVVVRGKENVVALPDGVSLRDAATLGVAGITAYQCLAPYVKPGSKVLINGGSGGTGTFGIQIAKILGCDVTTTTSGPNIPLCTSLGADEIIDYKTTDLIQHLNIPSGTQYDLLIDNVNTPTFYWNAHSYLKPSGLYVTIAATPSLGSVMSMLRMLYLPTWLGGGRRAAKFHVRKSDAGQYAELAAWMAEARLNAVVEREYEFEEAAEAFARLKSGRVVGKLVVKVAGQAES